MAKRVFSTPDNQLPGPDPAPVPAPTPVPNQPLPTIHALEQAAFQAYAVTGNSNNLLDQLRQIDSVTPPMTIEEHDDEYVNYTCDPNLVRQVMAEIDSLVHQVNQPVIIQNPALEPARPRSPREMLPSYPRVQFRVGKNDWEILMKLNTRLNELQSDISAFNDFLRRKQNPEISKRVDLAELNLEDLKSAFDKCMEHSYYTENHGHQFISDPPPRGVQIASNGNRPQCAVKYADRTRGNTYVFGTAIVLYFKPTKCHTVCENGRICGMRHRTVHEFSEAHPQHTPNEVHVSHLCHHSSCVYWRHLIMEPSNVNLRRNVCRRECTCGSNPKCYTDM